MLCASQFKTWVKHILLDIYFLKFELYSFRVFTCSGKLVIQMKENSIFLFESVVSVQWHWQWQHGRLTEDRTKPECWTWLGSVEGSWKCSFVQSWGCRAFSGLVNLTLFVPNFRATLKCSWRGMWRSCTHPTRAPSLHWVFPMEILRITGHCCWLGVA